MPDANQNVQQDPALRTEEDQRIIDLAKEIKNFMQEGLARMPDNTSTNAVIVLGATGSGKSTLINLLAKKPLFARRHENSRKFFLDSPDMLPGITIGNKITSETFIPHSWVYNDNTVYWDCPGFNDNRGTVQDVVNSFLIKKLFNAHQPCKILIVVSDADLNDIRATKLLSEIRALEAFFQSDIKKIKPGLMLVVSEANPDKTADDIQRTLQSIIDTPKFALTDPQKEILQGFIDKDKPIIIFKKPVVEGAFDTTCAQEYLETIENLGVINKLQVNSIISSATRLAILEMYTYLLRSINLEIDNLMDGLSVQLQSSIASSQQSKDPTALQAAVKDFQKTSAKFDNKEVLSNQQLLEIASQCMQFNVNHNTELLTLNSKTMLLKTEIFDFLEQFVEQNAMVKLGIQAAITGYLSNCMRDANSAIQTIEQQITEERITTLQFNLQREKDARIAAEAEMARLAAEVRKKEEARLAEEAKRAQAGMLALRMHQEAENQRRHKAQAAARRTQEEATARRAQEESKAMWNRIYQASSTQRKPW